MLNLQRKGLNFIFYSHIFFGICAVAQVLVCYNFLNLKPNINVCMLIFTATICVYNFNSLTSLLVQIKNPSLKKWFSLICFFVLILLILKLALFTKILVFFLAITCFAYHVPLAPFLQKKLRNINGLKLSVIALVWTLSVVLLPAIEARVYFFTRQIIVLLAQQFVFFTLISTLFDIKDLNYDKALNLKTIPVVFGEKTAYLFCKLLLFFYLLLLFMFSKGNFNNSFFAGSLTAILIYVLILNPKWRNNTYYYCFFLDGVLLAQYIFLCIINLLV